MFILQMAEKAQFQIPSAFEITGENTLKTAESFSKLYRTRQKYDPIFCLNKINFFLDSLVQKTLNQQKQPIWPLLTWRSKIHAESKVSGQPFISERKL